MSIPPSYTTTTKCFMGPNNQKPPYNCWRHSKGESLACQAVQWKAEEIAKQPKTGVIDSCVAQDYG